MYYLLGPVILHGMFTWFTMQGGLSDRLGGLRECGLSERLLGLREVGSLTGWAV